MSKISNRMKLINEKVGDNQKHYEFPEALNLLKELSSVKFLESLDVSVSLGIDARKSDQNVRGSVVLPGGTGKTSRVAVFTSEANFEAAKSAGADVVGLDDLADSVKKGDLNFDVVIATPDAMRVVGQLGQILGPKGLMPNPKVGTVTTDFVTAIKNAKSGQIQFRNDKNGIIHASIGKIDFSLESLTSNITALLETLKKIKPASSKGHYIKSISVSTTMGPGLKLNKSSLV